MAEKTKKRSDLDRSIDIGIDQFGRFARLRWFWLVLLAIVMWYIVAYIIPQLTPPSPGAVLIYAFQIAFAIFFAVIQFVAIFWFLGRARIYWVMPGETGVNFEDYKGNPEVLEAARRIVTLIQGVKEFQEIGGQPVRGLLLTGDPGTGKSYLAQCMSAEAGVPFGYCSSSGLQSMFMGIGVLIIGRLYRKARKLAREYGGCILFLDEIDAIGTARSSQMGGGMGMGGGLMGMGAGLGVLNQLLMEMDPPPIETGWFKKILRGLGLTHGRFQREPVLTIGATNLAQSLDKALLRPGRFDRKVIVAPPTDRYRPEVIEYYLNKVKHEPNISIKALSARLVDYTPVAIKHVVNEAAIIAHFDGRNKVTYKDLVEAQDIHEYGLRQLSELTPIERRRLAYHEAGHAVACYYLMERFFPAFVTIHMHRSEDLDGAAAFAAWRQTEEVITMNKQDMLARIQVSVASRAAEEMFLNTQLNGVAGDFAGATYMATLYIGAIGMDGTLSSYLAFRSPQGANPFVLPKLAERIEDLLQSQMKAVKKLFQDHSEAVMALAEALIDRDELVAEEIKEIIDAADARQVAKKVMSEFQPLLGAGSNGNGHNGNGHNGNGHTHSNGQVSEPRVVDSTLNLSSNPPLSEQKGMFFSQEEDTPEL
ncbi:MAG TPA: AAA family ATPase [Ktedonosporobacter sp.]|nr:AAA family ATPase [Ktedonosporobacter sp.]